MTFPTTWINLKGIMLSEVRQTLYDFTYMCNLKKISKKKTKQKQTHRYTEQTYGLPEGRGWGDRQHRQRGLNFPATK